MAKRDISARKKLSEAEKVLQIANEASKQREYENEIIELKERIFELEEELENYKTATTVNSLNDEIIFKILDFRARNYSPNIIQDKLMYINIDITIDEIESIINNIESLTSEQQKKYKEFCQAYEDSIKINPSILKQSNLIDNQFCIDKTQKKINSMTDTEELGKWLDRLDRYINTKTKLLGDVVLKNEEDGVDNSRIINIRENLNERSRRILQDFNPESLRVVK